MSIILKSICDGFVSMLTDCKDPKVFIMRKFIQYYVETELQKKGQRKGLCTNFEINLIIMAIKKKFGDDFNYDRKQYQRLNDKFLFGL